jgi:hypothetical protein
LPLDFANIVPENNLRLPDAITITQGPRRLLARFVLEGDKAARRMGLYLRVRHDFDALLALNRFEATRGNWYQLPYSFDPERTKLGPENAFWISAENQAGEIVATWAARIHYWPESDLAEQARAVFYGVDHGEPCIVTAPGARAITGFSVFGGCTWVRPDFRGKQLYRLLPRIAKAYAFGQWPLEWSFCFITRELVDRGLAVGYGQKNLSYSIFYPQSPWGDVEFAVAYTSAEDTYAEFADFLETELCGPSAAVLLPMTAVHDVTKISSDDVFHGRSSLS